MVDAEEIVVVDQAQGIAGGRKNPTVVSLILLPRLPLTTTGIAIAIAITDMNYMVTSDIIWSSAAIINTLLLEKST